jgi:tetratricopeptide (TPR) repeat protein
MSTKKLVKKNIKEDQLVTAAVRFSQWAQHHFNHILIGLVVLVGLVVVLVFTANSRQSAALEAERQLGAALAQYQQDNTDAARAGLQSVIQRFSGKNAALARYYKAELELKTSNYSQAITDFDLYLENSGDFPLFVEAGKYGRAVAQAGLENFSGAAESFVELLEELDESDPRYLDSVYQAGSFFLKAGNIDRAAQYFTMAYEKGTGTLKDKASVELALLGR